MPFTKKWLGVQSQQQLREIVLRDHVLVLRVATNKPNGALVGRPVQGVDLPKHTTIGAIRRYGKTLVPSPEQALKADDQLTIIGEPVAIRRVKERYGD